MNEYWDNEWKNAEISEYEKYINPNGNPKFFDIFKKHNISYVCDAACGFGAYSVMLNNSGYKTAGFDISEHSVNLTKDILKHFGCNNDNYKVCSITNIDFDDESFDAVAAHAVIDHLSAEDAKRALDEIFRITRKEGLIYISFDGIEEDDINMAHEVLEDGSFLYSDESRKGLLFKHYSEDDIRKLISGKEQVYFNITKKGDREFILKK